MPVEHWLLPLSCRSFRFASLERPIKARSSRRSVISSPKTAPTAEASVAKLAELGDPRAVAPLDALIDDRLRAAPDGAIYFEDASKKPS